MRNWYDVGGTENGALLIPPPSARLVLQCKTFVSPSRSQTKKTSDAHRDQQSVFRGVGPGNSYFFSTTHVDPRDAQLAALQAQVAAMMAAPAYGGKFGMPVYPPAHTHATLARIIAGYMDGKIPMRATSAKS